MNLRKRVSTIISILALTLLTAISAQAALFDPATDMVDLTVSDATIDASGVSYTVAVQVMVDDASPIAGAAFTVMYDTEDLILDSVTSEFFGTFTAQSVGVPQALSPSVMVGGVTYTQPLVYTETTMESMVEGTMLAAARVEAPGGAAAGDTLFTLIFDIRGAFNGVYPIMIMPSMINNPTAGYDPTANPPTDMVPTLVGAATEANGDPLADLANAFPEIMVDMFNEGSITVIGSDMADAFTINTSNPFNLDTEQYVDPQVNPDGWHVWLQADDTLLLNDATICLEGAINDLADWPAGTVPDHSSCGAASIAPEQSSIYSIVIDAAMGEYALVEITTFVLGSGEISFNFLPIGDWDYAHDENGGGGCGGEYSISGTITDGTDGIQGLWLDIFSDTIWCGTRVMTDENGAYTATGLIAAPDYRVSYWPPPPDELMEGQIAFQDAFYDSSNGPSYTTKMWDMTTMLALSGGTTSYTGINMEFSTGASISGTITTDTDIFPVFIEAWSEASMSWGGTKVDASGDTYTITGLSDSGGFTEYRVTVRPYWDPNTNTPPAVTFMDVFWNDADSDLGTPGGTRNWDLADLVAATATDIDFNITEGGTIEGQVTSDGFHGIAGIWVNAWSESAGNANAEGAWGGATTDTDGTYKITGLNTGSYTYTVDVFDPNYAYQYQDNIDVGSTGIDFILSTGASISGVISDGSPVSGVWVEAWSPSTGAWGGAMSGENPDFTFNTTGTYTIGGLPPADDYIVSVRPYNYPAQDYFETVSTYNGDVDGINFTLTAGKHIAGQVTSDGATPVAGIWIDAYSDSTWNGGGATTDANGDYTITNLPDASDYRVSYWPDPHQALPYKQTFYSDGGGTYMWDLATLIDITSVSADGKDFTLTTANATISGQVTSGANPLAWIWVDAWSPVDYSWGGANTDQSGNYIITGLTEDASYNVTVYPFNSPPLTSAATATEAGVDFDLAVASGETLTGTVTSGGPVADAWVNVWSASTGSWGNAQTDDQGNFTITGLSAADDFEVNVWTPDGISYTVQNVDSTGGSGLVISVPAGATITGIIEGVPAGTWDIWIDAWSDSNWSWGGTKAMNAGDGVYEYTIKGLVDSEEVADYRVSVNGYNPSNDTGLMSLFYDGNSGTTIWDNAVLVAAPSAGINFTFDLGSSISGTVSIDDITAPDGRLEGIWVDAWSESTWSWGGGMADINGDYVISGLASASDYRVSVWKEGYASVFYNSTASTPNWDNATLVDVTSGNVTDIDISLSVGGSITGTVTDTSNKALAGVWIDVWSESQMFGRGAMTDQQGNYKVDGLLKNVTDYQVTAYPSGNFKAVTKTGKKVGDTVDFTLSEGFTFYGELVKAGPSAYTGGAWVDIWNNNFYGWAEVTSGSSTFSINGLSTGTYNVIIWPQDFGYVMVETSVADPENYSNSAAPKSFTMSTGESISGTVTANSSGVAGVWVDAWSETTWSWGGTATDSSGAYTITGLVSGSDYIIHIWSPIYPSAELTGISTGATDADFTLSTGGSISGTVYGTDGKVASGVWVEAFSTANSAWGGAETGSDGTYSISGLKENKAAGGAISDYVVTVYPEDLASASQSGKSVGDTVNFNLTAGTSIIVNVYESGTGAGDPPVGATGLEGVTVKVFTYHGGTNDYNGSWIGDYYTDANGYVEIKGLPTDTKNNAYNIKIKKSGVGSKWYDGDNEDNDNPDEHTQSGRHDASEEGHDQVLGGSTIWMKL